MPLGDFLCILDVRPSVFDPPWECEFFRKMWTDVMRPELIQAIELLASKDEARVNEALGLLQNTVYSFSMKVCGHREDAEDTMQAVLFKSLPHLAKLEDPRATAVW